MQFRGIAAPSLLPSAGERKSALPSVLSLQPDGTILNTATVGWRGLRVGDDLTIKRAPARYAMKVQFALVAAFLLLALPATASAPREIGAAQLVGEARFTLLGFALFDAALYTPSGEFSWSDDFALAVTYRRGAPREVLLNRTIRGMSERGAGDAATLAPLRARLAECFSDVARGDRFTGISTGPDTVRFYLNGEEQCAIAWPGFRRAFFGIWLDARGTHARLSAQLRGDA